LVFAPKADRLVKEKKHKKNGNMVIR